MSSFFIKILRSLSRSFSFFAYGYSVFSATFIGKKAVLYCFWSFVNDHLTMGKVKALVAQSYLTLCNPMDCSPPGSSVHGILQTRMLEWVAIPFCRGSFRPRGWTWVSLIAGSFSTVWATRENPSWLYLRASISGLSVLLHCSICLFSHQYYTVLNIVVFILSLDVG